MGELLFLNNGIAFASSREVASWFMLSCSAKVLDFYSYSVEKDKK